MRHSKYSGEDLFVFIQYPKPVKVKRKRVVPLMNKIGPKFKDRARTIAEALKNAEPDDEITLTINGEEIKISKEFFEVVEVEEEITGEKVVPHVIEPSFGLDRITYAVLEHCFDRDVVDGEERRVLRLKRWVAPVQVAVLPLLSKDPFTSKAMEITSKLKKSGFFTEYDDSGSIGRRYRRFDEIGTPFCVTIDHQTFEDDTVTIRDRDTTRQIRVEVTKLVYVLNELLNSERDLFEFGVVFKE
jgi:glycyl-tRNA synthetase